MNMDAYKSALTALEMYGNVVSICGRSRASAEMVASMLRAEGHDAIVVKTKSGLGGRRYAVKAVRVCW